MKIEKIVDWLEFETVPSDSEIEVIEMLLNGSNKFRVILKIFNFGKYCGIKQERNKKRA